MAALLDDAMQAGAWGLSTSQLDVDMHGRPVPSRAADDAEVDALLDVLERAGHGLVEIVPGLLGADPEIMMEDLARRCGARGIPLTWTGFTYSDSNPAYTENWLPSQPLAAEGIGFYPQQSPRTVDFRLNWDSSMMFMSMPQGWHKVIAARGDEQARAARPIRPGGRPPARSGTGSRRPLFPHRRPEKVRFVEVRGRQPAVARPHAGRPGRREAVATRPTCSPTSCWPTTAGRPSSPSASPTPTSTA